MKSNIHITDSEKDQMKRTLADFIKKHPIRIGVFKPQQQEAWLLGIILVLVILTGALVLLW